MAAYVDSTGVTNLTADIKALADATYVNNITYDTTNKKITKTIGSTTTDVVSLSTLKDNLGILTGRTTTALNLSTKIVNIDGDFTLAEGVIIIVEFGSGSGVMTKLNVANSGDINVFRIPMNTIPENAIVANGYGVFRYNGQSWYLIGSTSYLISTAMITSGTSEYYGLVNAKILADSFVKEVYYYSTNHKLRQTINGTSTDIVTLATLKSDLGLGTISFEYIRDI